MAISTEEETKRQVFNVPNQLSAARLVLAVVLFVFLAYEFYMTSFVLFIIAATTDWIDGYYARKYGQVTQLGRILDPFADKIIICGTFIFLAAVAGSEIRPWMAVVIVGRELLVTVLRTFFEQQGADFSARLLGKLKMVLQCFAVGFSLFRLTYLPDGVPPDWIQWSLVSLVWATVIITIYSGVDYVFAAIRLVRQ